MNLEALQRFGKLARRSENEDWCAAVRREAFKSAAHLRRKVLLRRYKENEMEIRMNSENSFPTGSATGAYHPDPAKFQ